MPTRIITASSNLAGTPGRVAVVHHQHQGDDGTSLSRLVHRGMGGTTAISTPPRIGTPSTASAPHHIFNHNHDNNYNNRARGGGGAFRTPTSRRATPEVVAKTKSGSIRRVVGFRSSIIRELSTPKKPGDLDTDDDDNDDDATQIHLSTTDIRASPRLVGYLFALVASTVMLVSVVKFYQTRNVGAVPTRTSSSGNHHAKVPTAAPIHHLHPRAFLPGFNQRVYQWKFWGAVGVASAGVFLNLGIMLVHFDTVFLPRLWFHIFRDGSRGEGILLVLLLLFWAAGLHTCTSSLSVGSSQANVYFTSWICFGATCLNYGVWRTSANLPSLAERLVQHERETTYNWAWTLLFVCISAGAATDLYYNRDVLVFRQDGFIVQVSRRDWFRALAIPWAMVLMSSLAIVLNHYLSESASIPFCGSNYRLVIGWRQLEGFVILAFVGVLFWIIYAYTGVNDVITGLNNAYFGIWGSFFNSVFTFGTWLRENKNIEYIVKVGQDQDSDDSKKEEDYPDVEESTRRGG